MTSPVNARDLGGLPLAGGGTTAYGVLLRGDAPYADDEPPSGLVWPPAVVIDLRSARERTRSPYHWPDATTVVARELFDAGDLSRLPHRTTLMDIYRDMIAFAGPGIAGLVDRLAAEGATYVHCAAGKDRTGIAVAAMLLLAGVREEAVVTDYQQTSKNIDSVLARVFGNEQTNRAWDPAWAETPTEAITLLIEEVTSHRGGPREWFLRHGTTETAIDRFLARITRGESAYH